MNGRRKLGDVTSYAALVIMAIPNIGSELLRIIAF